MKDSEYTFTKEQAQDMWNKAWNNNAYAPHVVLRRESMDRFEVVAEVYPRSSGYIQLLEDDEIANIFEEHGYFVAKEPEHDGSIYILKKKEEK